MKLEKLAGGCDDGDCPTVYVTDQGTLVVQGGHIDKAEGLRLGEGEQAVEIPIDLLREAFSALGK